jgi:hypothetical protein
VLFLFEKYGVGEIKVINIIEGGDKMETNLREFYKNRYLYDRIPYIHFSNEEMIVFEEEVDLCIGDMSIQSSKHINPPVFIPLDFDNYEKFILHYIDRINRTVLHENTDFLLDNYSNVNVNEEVSRKMWDILWLPRGARRHEL